MPKPSKLAKETIAEFLKALNAKHEDLLRQAEEIARKIQEMTISFDHDRDGNVIVHGVGAQPLKAHYESWLRFLRQNGGAGLREYITKNCVEFERHSKGSR